MIITHDLIRKFLIHHQEHPDLYVTCIPDSMHQEMIDMDYDDYTTQDDICYGFSHPDYNNIYNHNWVIFISDLRKFNIIYRQQKIDNFLKQTK